MMVKGENNGIDGAGGRRSRGVSGWLGAAVVSGAALLTGSAWAGPDESVQPMTEAMTKALGSAVTSTTTVDEDGNIVLYLRPDVYDQVSAINYQSPVQFPVPPQKVGQITKVEGVPGSSVSEVFITYEGSPAKTLDCKYVGTIYRCFSN
jgi:hypothetical protein